MTACQREERPHYISLTKWQLKITCSSSIMTVYADGHCMSLAVSKVGKQHTFLHTVKTVYIMLVNDVDRSTIFESGTLQVFKNDETSRMQQK